ncbi:MAG: CocE/NonD family hydrolase [Chitinophagales bacterium]|nr:CocE/NonD family hydrolase [Chitinophagales bacterium]MDW8418826.1 CocE/NonD family hydrolase [Chitinophagales bacterium]
MKKFFAALASVLIYFNVSSQNINGQLDDFREFCTKVTVPFVMPDGVKLMTDVYVPRLRDSLRISLGTIDLGFTTLVTDTITLIPVGAQIIMYDSLNWQPNPNPYQLPTIFTRTPYNKGEFDEVGAVLAILGYNRMFQDMRGRYTSEGVYFPMYSDSWNKNAYHPNVGHILDYLPNTDPKHSNRHEDGYHSLKIIEKLTYPGFYDGLPHTNERISNGWVGMFGASALGNTQLQLALSHRVTDSMPNLKCLMPIVATSEHYLSTGYNNGVFRDRLVTGWLKGQIFSGTDDDLIPIDYDRQNSIHTSADYDLPKTITINRKTRVYQANKFEAANINIDHFTAMRYPDENGVLRNCGFYPNSYGRPDMDASRAPVNEFGEAVNPVTQRPLPNLTYSRYTNLNIPVMHLTGWWDIFTEGQIYTRDFTYKHINNKAKQLQKIVIGPWAHQTMGRRISGDRTYPKNVTELTKIDLTDLDINEVPLSDLLKSDLITWFRYCLNYDSSHYLGEPKFIIRESNRWQKFGNAGFLGDIYVRVPAEDYKVPFVDMVNFLTGFDGLKALKIEVKIPNLNQQFITTQDIPKVSTGLPVGGTKLTGNSYTDFINDVANYRMYIPGPDSAADAAAGYPDNHKYGNYWLHADKFPVTEHLLWKRLYLHQDGSMNENPPTTDEGYRMYIHDPDDPILTVGGNNMIVRSPDGTRNSQSQMEMSAPENAPYTMNREGVIQFNTEPLTDSFSILGFPVCTLYAKTNPGGVESGPTDTDWFVRLCDVWPDGRVYFVQEGCVNARARDFARALVDDMEVPGSPKYGNGGEDPGDWDIPYSNINIGQIYEYVFKFQPIGYTFAPGHRLRILISSSNYTRYQVNPNVPLEDGEFFRRKPGDGQTYNFQGKEYAPRVSVQRIHFSPDHPTNINFPMFRTDYFYTGAPQVHVTSLDMTLFPNPTSDVLHVFVNKPGDHLLEITDITGKQLYTARFDDNVIVNAESFGSGIYFATVSDVKNPGDRKTKKFIVQ